MTNLSDDLEILIRTSQLPEGIDWFGLCQNFLLPEDFIREFTDYINWEVVAKFQWTNVSEDFIREFRDKFPNVILWEDQTQENKERTVEICRYQKWKKQK